MKVKTGFTKREIDIAVKVLKESRTITNWVKSQAKFLGIDLSTPAGEEFYERETRAAAARLLKQ